MNAMQIPAITHADRQFLVRTLLPDVAVGPPPQDARAAYPDLHLTHRPETPMLLKFLPTSTTVLMLALLVLSGMQVGCGSQDECVSGEICGGWLNTVCRSDGTCPDSCASDADCAGGTFCSTRAACISECEANEDCPDNFACFSSISYASDANIDGYSCYSRCSVDRNEGCAAGYDCAVGGVCE